MGAQNYKIIEVVVTVGHSPMVCDPLQGISNGREYLGDLL